MHTEIRPPDPGIVPALEGAPMSPPTPEPNDYGYKLSTYRKRLNLSQDEFASAAGLTCSQVAQLERGEPVVDGCVILSRYLQCLAESVLAERRSGSLLATPGV